LALRQGLSLDDLAPRDLAAIQLSVSKVLDLTDEDTLKRIGLSLSEIMGNDVSRCIEVSRLARRAGFEAVLAPSATSRGPILVVYPDRLLSSSRLEVSARRKILRN
jgi:hypothetical protein